MADVRYEIKVIVPLGVKIFDSPRPEAKGAQRRRSESVGITLHASDILIIEGVPYGELIPRDPQKPEFVRISEAGGLVKDDITGKVIQFDSVLTYCKVKNVETAQGGDTVLSILREMRDHQKRIADALERN